MAQSATAMQARRIILESAAQNPGMRLSAIAAVLALDYNTTLRHARTLAKRGAIFIDEDGGRALFPAGAMRPPPTAPPRVVAALVAVHRGAGTPSMLARELGVSRASAGGLLDLLEKRGLVRREAASWRVVTDQAASALQLDGQRAA